jgi:hypothetical protein
MHHQPLAPVKQATILKTPALFLYLSFLSFFLSSSLIAHGVVLFNNEIHARQAA